MVIKTDTIISKIKNNLIQYFNLSKTYLGNKKQIDCCKKELVEYCHNKSQKFDSRYGINLKGEIFILSSKSSHTLETNYNKAIFPSDINLENNVYRFLAGYIILNLNTLTNKKELLNVNIEKMPMNKYNQVIVNGYLLLKHKITNIEEYSFWYINRQNIELINIDNQYKIDIILSSLLNNIKYKSLKRLLYQIYQTEKTYKIFYPNAFYVISRTFTNVNNMINVLNNDFFRSNSFSKFDLQFYIYIINFLINIYGEKNIVHFLNTIYNIKNDKLNFWLDTIEVFKILYDIPDYLIEENFHKIKLNIDSIHEEFVRLHREENVDNIIFNYSDTKLKTQTYHENLIFKLPVDKYELIDWANTLHNCMAIYSEDISCQKTLIYGVFLEDDIKYAVRVVDKEILEMRGKYNASISVSDSKVIRNWLHKCY